VLAVATSPQLRSLEISASWVAARLAYQVHLEQADTYPQHESPLERRNGTMRRWILGALALVLFAGCYLWAGFALVPGLIRTQATAWVKTNLNKPIALGEIRFNPITFTVDVSDIAIPGPGRPMVAVGHLRIGFSVLSLFQHAYRFNEVRLDRPFVRAVVRPDRSLNLIELVPQSTAATRIRATPRSWLGHQRHLRKRRRSNAGNHPPGRIFSTPTP